MNYISGTEQAVPGRRVFDHGAQLLLHVGLQHGLRKVRALDGFGIKNRLRERGALRAHSTQIGILQVGVLEGSTREVGSGEIGALAVALEKSCPSQTRL